MTSWRRGVLAGTAVVVATGCGDPTTTDPTVLFQLEAERSFPELTGDDFLTQLAFTDDGVLWATTFRGSLFRIAADGTTRFEAEAVIGAGGLHDLFIDGANRVWATAGESVAVFEGGAWTSQTPPDRMGLDPRATQVAVNGAGDVLVAMGTADAGGLLLRRDGTWQALTPDNSDLPSPIVREIAVGPDDDFWVASATLAGAGGLSRVSGGAVVAVHTIADGLLYDWIDDVGATGDGIFLGYRVMLHDVAGPDGGLQKITATGEVLGTWHPHETGLTSSRVESLVHTSAGELWFTMGLDHHPVDCPTCYSGVGVLDAAGRLSVRSTLNSDLAPNEYLPDIAEGPGGNIYIVAADRNQVLKVVRFTTAPRP